MPTFDDAIQYMELGLRVIPTRPESKRPAVHSVRRWRDEEPSRKTLWRWWQDESRGMAVMLGEPSCGHVVRDFDDGDAYLEWACDHRRLAQMLPTCKTVRGWHIHFRADLSDVRDLSPTGRTIILYDDGELKAGGQAMLPESRHPSGPPYEWERSPFDVGIPYVDDLVVAGLGRPPKESINPVETSTLCPHPHFLTQDNSGHLKDRKVDTTVAVENAQAAIEGSLPSGPGQRHVCLFRLARMLKALPEYATARVEDLKPIVKEWYRLARPIIRTKDWLTSWDDFAEGWGQVRHPWGAYVMGDVVAVALREGCPPEVLDDCDGDPSGLVAGICRELARRGEGSFFLDCRTLGRHVGASPDSAAAILRGLCRLGLLSRTRKGRRRQASEYRYLGEL